MIQIYSLNDFSRFVCVNMWLQASMILVSLVNNKKLVLLTLDLNFLESKASKKRLIINKQMNRTCCSSNRFGCIQIQFFSTQQSWISCSQSSTIKTSENFPLNYFSKETEQGKENKSLKKSETLVNARWREAVSSGNKPLIRRTSLNPFCSQAFMMMMMMKILNANRVEKFRINSWDDYSTHKHSWR